MAGDCGNLRGFTASRFGCRGERPAAGAQLRAEGGADVLQRGDRGGKGFVYFSETAQQSAVSGNGGVTFISL